MLGSAQVVLDNSLSIATDANMLGEEEGGRGVFIVPHFQVGDLSSLQDMFTEIDALSHQGKL